MDQTLSKFLLLRADPNDVVTRAEELGRIDGGAVDDHLVMDVRTGATAGAAQFADGIVR